ncbi:hypothetical protein BBK36DRAFT_1195333 [Trichoderma citrinoviride]|uniref:Uncharacterized protein n=1 Tax=Trichoderma citrinoviride TaxID=58853 RepID=A0A2T4BFZ7_9HYPO|nr:hypothetical protein BBK36DRAFT_1195333 [Trichoderma citrinoviride]PTB68243.1 hypothetical protein BBK36DRAFT_1195333 [Trichoderma citrinoviride]
MAVTAGILAVCLAGGWGERQSHSAPGVLRIVSLVPSSKDSPSTAEKSCSWPPCRQRPQLREKDYSYCSYMRGDYAGISIAMVDGQSHTPGSTPAVFVSDPPPARHLFRCSMLKRLTCLPVREKCLIIPRVFGFFGHDSLGDADLLSP